MPEFTHNINSNLKPESGRILLRTYKDVSTDILNITAIIIVKIKGSLMVRD